MATALASQLQALASSNHQNSSLRSKTKPSILFNPSEAADIDIATIFSFALSGLEELIAQNYRFATFKKSLFAAESCQTEREVQGKEFNENLNVSIHNFMALVADYLLLSAAHQTLEFLIRRYKIHIYNVEDLIKYSLPYHETSLFVRLLQLSNVEQTRWKFLQGVKISGATPPRELLVQQCLRDMAVLEGICESGHSSVSGKCFRSKTIYSFSTTIIIEVLASAQEISSTLLIKILPFIAQSFEKGSSEEIMIGGLMVIGTLTCKSTLASEVSTSFIDSIAKALLTGNKHIEGGKLLELSMMVIFQIMQTQTVRCFPEKAFESLTKLREFSHVLKRIFGSFKCEKAFSLILKGLIARCALSPRYGNILEELIQSIPLQEYAELIGFELLELCLSQERIEKLLVSCEIKKLLLIMKNEFPKELDMAVNKFIESHHKESSAGMDIIFAFLHENFDGTLHKILPSTNQSIYQSLKHPKACFRSMALEQVAEILRNNSEMKMICTEALLIGLSDDDLSVVNSVLSIDGLEKLLDATEFLTCLLNVLARCTELIRNGPPAVQSQPISVRKKCLGLLASSYSQSNPIVIEKIGHVFLNDMFLFPKTWQLNLTALRLAKDIKWAFFRGLSSIKDDMFDARNIKDKKSRKIWIHDVNAEIVELLANGICEDPGSFPVTFSFCTGYCKQAKCFVLQVLLKMLSRGSEGLTWELTEKYFGFLKQEWTIIESSKEFSTFKINTDSIKGDSLFSYEFFKIVQREPNLALAHLVVASFYSILLSVPLIEKRDKKGCKKSWSSMMEDLFVVFSSPLSRSIFQEHTELLLRRIPMLSSQFLSNIFNAEGGSIPVSAQVHSLNVLCYHWDVTKATKISEMQYAVPHLLTALASPTEAIRRAAYDCLKKLVVQIEDNSMLCNVSSGFDVEKDVIDVKCMHKFLELLLEFKSSFISDGSFISKFLISSLGSSKEHMNKVTQDATLSKSTRKSIFLFLLRHATKFSLYAQHTLLAMLRGIGFMKEQALETKNIFELLLRRWSDRKVDGSNEDTLSKIEIELFQLLLQVHLHNDGTINDLSFWFQTTMTILNIDDDRCMDSTVIETVCTVLSCFEENIFNMLDASSQDVILTKLIALSQLNPAPLQTASRAALRKINVRPDVLMRFFNELANCLDDTSMVVSDENIMRSLESVNAIIEFLLSKKEMIGMFEFIHVLFDFLYKLRKIELNLNHHGRKTNPVNGKALESHHIHYLQKCVLEVIENIVNCTEASDEAQIDKRYDVDLLVEFIHGTIDINTVNQALSLLTVLARTCPNLVLEHVISVFSVLGETTLVQDDSHSYLLTEKLISAVVPIWLEKFRNPRLLLEILVKALPQIPAHRRTPLLKTTISFMQESASLHILLLLLMENSILSLNDLGMLQQKRSRNSTSKSVVDSDLSKWCEEFGSSICEEYTLLIRMPGLFNLLKCSGEVLFPKDDSRNFDGSGNAVKVHEKVVKFVSRQLDKIREHDELQHQGNEEKLRGTFIEILEVVLSHLQKSNGSSRVKKRSSSDGFKSLQDALEDLLQSITNLLSIDAFTDAIIHLLRDSDTRMKIRALRIVTTKLKLNDAKWNAMNTSRTDGTVSYEAYERLLKSIISCLEMNGDGSELALAAIASLKDCGEILANKMPSLFSSTIPILMKGAMQNLSLATACLKCIALIILETGPNSLPVLNEIIKGVLEIGKKVDVGNEVELYVTTLSVLEACIKKLSGFLSPYLDEMLGLLLLDQRYIASSNNSLNDKLEELQQSLSKMVPVRHLITPLINIYEKCLQTSEHSVLACMKMLSVMVSSFDRTSIATYHARIFELCLAAFDLRRRSPSCFSSVAAVETSVITLFSGLVLKLNEKTFKPLFVRVLEWAETEVPDGHGENRHNRNISRNIVFYRVINHLTEKLRSVFVPYFQYLLKGSVQLLRSENETHQAKSRKKSKMSVEHPQHKQNFQDLSSNEWHLRYCIVSALHKCFLYDNVGFLDTEKFQMLLGPLVEQITTEKPSLEEAANSKQSVPSSQEMDEALVLCLGQMAITAGTDLLWKPLNHEVLLCSRSDSARVKMLSLNIIKFLVDHLREDYLGLLPETIPFLAELLEDGELRVVSKSQEIIKLLEELSGESLSQYL